MRQALTLIQGATQGCGRVQQLQPNLETGSQPLQQHTWMMFSGRATGQPGRRMRG